MAKHIKSTDPRKPVIVAALKLLVNCRKITCVEHFGGDVYGGNCMNMNDPEARGGHFKVKVDFETGAAELVEEKQEPATVAAHNRPVLRPGTEITARTSRNRGPGDILRYGVVGTCHESLTEYDERAKAGKPVFGSRQEVLDRIVGNRKRGDTQAFAIQHCSVIDNSGLSFAEKYPERMTAIEIKHGETYMVEHGDLGLFEMRASIVGNFSTLVRFTYVDVVPEYASDAPRSPEPRY
jgi:hypothetical protein